jgi:outer membrane lipoprotein SlyB
MRNTFGRLGVQGLEKWYSSYSGRRVATLVVAALLVVMLAGCAPQPKAVNDTWDLGALRARLDTAVRQDGALTVVITVTNPSDSNQPIAALRKSTVVTKPDNADFNAPWVTNSKGQAVATTTGSFGWGASGLGPGLVGGPPNGGPEMLRPGGGVEIKASFVDSGPGAIVYYAPLGRKGASPSATAAWKLP